MVTVGRAAVKFNPDVQEGTAPHLRAAETEKRLGVAVRHLVRPVASIALRIEGQAFRTIEHVAPAVHAVHELAAVLMIADLEVAVLMGTIVGWTCGLCGIFNGNVSSFNRSSIDLLRQKLFHWNDFRTTKREMESNHLTSPL